MIKPTDIVNTVIVMQLVTNVSKSTAFRMIAQVREAMHIEKPKVVFVKDFREYYGVRI